MQTLPPEILENVWMNLSVAEMLRLCSTSKGMTTICSNKLTWRKVLERDYGITSVSNNPVGEYIGQALREYSNLLRLTTLDNFPFEQGKLPGYNFSPSDNIPSKGQKMQTVYNNSNQRGRQELFVNAINSYYRLEVALSAVGIDDDKPILWFQNPIGTKIINHLNILKRNYSQTLPNITSLEVLLRAIGYFIRLLRQKGLDV